MGRIAQSLSKTTANTSAVDAPETPSSSLPKKSSTSYEKHLARTRTRGKAVYQERRRLGLCVTCATPVTQYAACADCRAVRREKEVDYIRRRNTGLPVRSYQRRSDDND